MQVTNFIALRKNPELVDFRNYCLSFYGYDGVYPICESVAMMEMAILEYLKKLSSPANLSLKVPATWGGGDSLDRERVRNILEIEASLMNDSVLGSLYGE